MTRPADDGSARGQRGAAQPRAGTPPATPNANANAYANADLDWANALAGRPPAGPQGDTTARLEAASLRAALRRWPIEAPALPADLAELANRADIADPTDATTQAFIHASIPTAPRPASGQPGTAPALARLLAEAQRQGRASAGNPARACAPCAALHAAGAWLRAALAGQAAGRPGHPPGRRPGAALRIGAGLALAGVLGLAVLPQWLAPPAEAPALRHGTQPQLRSEADPRASREALAGRLAAAGADVQRYERAGRYGLDAEFQHPPDAALRAWLAAQGLVLAADGSLRVEFRAAAP
ncbi:hypothetical protein [Aquabacterium sp. OR-4]|uniref:hypothetical protein n=1 Tax=Aquabacterium sp. OR-4 TaxID=2978127 RepID=UPI0028C6B1FC|nr:hypothetical protein [Aquabacterium sp. OR-4]MDT7835657.1 hypothetical protein [Aquabacterium sp. OR-4]